MSASPARALCSVKRETRAFSFNLSLACALRGRWPSHGVCSQQAGSDSDSSATVCQSHVHGLRLSAELPWALGG